MSLEKFNRIKKNLNLKQAMEAMINKEYDRAIELYSSAIKSDPNDWKIYINRCNCLEKIDNFEAALKDAETAIDLSPSQLSGHYRKGCLLLKKKQFRSAEKSFDAALNCDPTDHNSRLKLKETHKMFLEEFGFNDKEVDKLVDKYKNCSDISDAIIEGKLLKELNSRNGSVISAESPRGMTEETFPQTTNSINEWSPSTLTVKKGSFPDFNDMESTIDSINLSNDMCGHEGDIRKPTTLPLFRRSITSPPKASSPAVSASESTFSGDCSEPEVNGPTPKSRMVKTRPQIVRSIKT